MVVSEITTRGRVRVGITPELSINSFGYMPGKSVVRELAYDARGHKFDEIRLRNFQFNVPVS